MVWTTIWDVQDGLIQMWRTRAKLAHKNDQILFGLDNLLGCPEWPDPDLAAKLGAYERIGELPGATRSAATGSEIKII